MHKVFLTQELRVLDQEVRITNIGIRISALIFKANITKSFNVYSIFLGIKKVVIEVDKDANFFMVLLNHSNTKMICNNTLAIIVNKKQELDNEYTKINTELIFVTEIPEEAKFQTIWID